MLLYEQKHLRPQGFADFSKGDSFSRIHVDSNGGGNLIEGFWKK